MIITGFYAGLLGLWLAFLYLYVVNGRMKYKIGLGDGGLEQLTKRIRIHGNFVETVPYLLILMAILEDTEHSIYLLHAYGIGIILTRILHFIAISRTSKGSNTRLASGILTITLIVIASILLISNYLQSVIN